MRAWALGSSKAKPLEARRLEQLRPWDQPPITQESSVTKTLSQKKAAAACRCHESPHLTSLLRVVKEHGAEGLGAERDHGETATQRPPLGPGHRFQASLTCSVALFFCLSPFFALLMGGWWFDCPERRLTDSRRHGPWQAHSVASVKAMGLIILSWQSEDGSFPARPPPSPPPCLPLFVW